VARSGTGVVRLSAIPLLTWLSATVRTTPPRPAAAASPPYPRRGPLFSAFAIET